MCHEIALHRLCIITALLYFISLLTLWTICLLCLAENSLPAHAVAKPFFGYLDTESVILLLILAA